MLTGKTSYLPHAAIIHLPSSGGFMKRNTVFTLLTVVVLALALYGCINYEQEVTLNLDGSGTMKIHYWAKENNVMWLSSNKLAFDEAKIREQYKSDNITVSAVKVESDTKDSTKHVRVELAFKNIAKLTEVPGFKDMTISWTDKGETQVLSHVLKADSSAGGFGMSDYSVTYTYHMPAEVMASNATKTDGKALTWKYSLSDLGKEQTMTATVKKATAGNMMTIILIVVVVIALIVIVLLVVQRRSRPSGTS
jgi:uncharacterized lipoprotein YehR (DUF1307 family)